MAKITTTTGSDADLTLEPDGTGDINLTPGTNGDVNIPANKGITFGNDGEKIEGNATKLDIAAAEIDFSIEAGGDINIGTDIGLTFGDDGEKIEGDGTDLTVSSSGNFTVDATGDIILDAGGADVTLKDGGTTFGSLKQASGHLVIQPTSSKEIILNDQAGTAALTVDTSGQDVSINNGSIVISTAGQGIMFHPYDEAVTGPPGSDSNLLDDYEEGTWTPVLSDASSNGNTATMPTYNLGRYVKIGKLVTLTGLIGTSSTTGMTPGNAMYIQGLPFTVASGNEAKVGSTFGYGYGLATGTAGYNVGCYVEDGASYAMFTYWAATGGTNTFTVAMWSPDGRVMFNLSYISA